VLAVIVSCVTGGMDAAAGTVSAGKSTRASRSEHHCKCGMNCGETCCCAPRKPADSPVGPKRSPAKNRAVVELGPSPCGISSAPCGGALPPSAGPLVRLCEPADRPALMGSRPSAFHSLLAPPASDRVETLAGSRVDEPPERVADA
jgi:hypothetical protein